MMAFGFVIPSHQVLPIGTKQYDTSILLNGVGVHADSGREYVSGLRHSEALYDALQMQIMRL